MLAAPVWIGKAGDGAVKVFFQPLLALSQFVELRFDRLRGEERMRHRVSTDLD